MATRKDFVAGAREPEAAKSLPLPEGVRSLRDRLTRKPDHKSFLIHLTTWQGRPFNLRYTAGRPVVMEPAKTGGTYLFSGSGMIYASEEQAEIEKQIKRKGG